MDVYQRRRLVALSAVAAVFVILVLLIRSCGGDDEGATPLTSAVPGTTGAGGATPLSQQDFASQGDSICLETNTALSSVDTSDPDQAATDRAELLAGELQSLQSLTLAPGESGERKLENFLTALQKQVQAYDERSLAVERGDEGVVSQIDATIDEFAAEAQRAAKRFGFEACGDTSKVGDSSGGETTTSGGATATTTAVAPATTTPVAPATTTPVTPPDTGGGASPAPPPADDGGGSGSGGITP